MPEREKDFCKRMRLVNPDFEQRLWYDENLPKLDGEIGEVYKHFRKHKLWAFAADVMRIWLVYEYGGIYVDVDYEPVASISDWDLENKNGFFYHGDATDYTLSNGMFGIKKGHALAKHIVDSISTSNLKGYYPEWLGRTVKEFYDLEYKVSLDKLKDCFAKDGILFPYVREVEGYMLHHGLYSWGNEKAMLFYKRTEPNPFI